MYIIRMKEPTLIEFKNYYRDRGICMGDSHRNAKPLTPVKLERKYDKYIRKLKITQEKIAIKQESWNDVRNKVFKRDNNICQLYKKLSTKEKFKISSMLNTSVFGTLDPAHIFGKGAYPHMKHDVDNIVTLYRIFHSRLDAGQDPLTGKSISKNIVINWWIFIIGIERYEMLNERSKR